MQYASPRIALLVITGLNRGGAETQIVRLARGLHERDWDVQLVSIIDPVEFVSELRKDGIKVDSLGVKHRLGFIFAFFRMWKVVKALKPTVVVSFLFHADLVARLTAGLQGIPVITSIRNEILTPARREFLYRMTNHLSSRIVLNSSRAAKVLIDRGVIPQQKVQVVANGIDVESIARSNTVRAITRRALDVQDDEFLWLAAGRLEPQKGFDVLVSATCEVLKEYPRTRVVLAGKGPEQSRLLSMIESNKIRRGFTLLGLRDDIPDLLAAADGFVLSSIHEGMPNALMEALAAGRPVVSTRVGAVEELVSDGESGFLVEPSNDEKLAAAMIELQARSLDERARMGEVGRCHIRHYCGLGEAMSRWEKTILDGVRDAVGPKAYSAE